MRSSLVRRPPAGVMRKIGDGMPAQVSFSSSDRGSKLQGMSQNILNLAHSIRYCMKRVSSLKGQRNEIMRADSYARLRVLGGYF
ncbi:hypothetical protein AVEN_55826-1 [Araneus ventricosus]|uniref:Uncharacterized protein n=1 Tax=Araneus ventricosus TaxID=182803 RepID=A0A4Y2CMT3_ARAVE|nr:hypothetical protein AVEN_55826-1 [Araneus ventricosus]